MSTESQSAEQVFLAAILQEAREEKAPTSFLFSSATLVRSPWLWVLAFEARDVQSSDFTTPDATRGPLGKSFHECVEKVFSARDSPPFAVDQRMAEDVERLVGEFCALGTLFTRLPLSRGDPSAAAQEVITILRPLIEAAEATLRRMTALFVQSLGGSGERYLLARHLDPSLFAAAERDALRKATVRPEGPRDSVGRGRSDRRPRKTPRALIKCRKCGTTLSENMTWGGHWRHDCEKNTERVPR